MSTTRHLLPLDDLFHHEDVANDCPCGPTTKAVEREDGSTDWVVVHRTLDGRESNDRTRYESHQWNPTEDDFECVACGTTWQDCEGECPA